MNALLSTCRLCPCLLLVSLVITLACGSTHTPGDQSYAASVAPGTRSPADKIEEAILARLAELPPEQEENIEGQRVSAGRAYTAASGRQCRRVSITGPEARTVLVCLMPSGWAFVPKVMGAESSGT